jgi:hypothetical protein
MVSTSLNNERLLGLYRDHVGAIVALVSALVVVVRLWSVARFDPRVAYALLAVSVAPNILVGIAAVALTSALPATAFVMALSALAYARTRRPFTKRLVITIALVLGSIVFSPTSVVLLFLVVTIVMIVAFGIAWVVGTRLAFRGPGNEASFDSVSLASYIMVIAVLATSSTPWLPPERLTMTNGSTIAGYVAGNEEPWMVVLTNPSRQILYLDPQMVSTRTLCAVDEWEVPIPLLLSGGALPKC